MSTRPALARPVPWRLIDLLALWIMLIAGAVVLILAWWGSSSTAKQSDEIFWVNVGVGGILAAAVGIVYWVGAGRRAVGERRRRLMPDVVGMMAATDAVAMGASSDELVTAARMTRYHRADCPLVAGKPIRTASAARARSAGLEPCGVCQPGPPAAG